MTIGRIIASEPLFSEARVDDHLRMMCQTQERDIGHHLAVARSSQRWERIELLPKSSELIS